MLVSVLLVAPAATARAEKLPVPGGAIEIQFADGQFDLPQKVLLAHIARSACAVSDYYGHFPAPHYRMLIVPVAGRRGVLSGTTWGYGGAHSRILIGANTTQADLSNDWIVTHEMVHTAFPSVGEEHHWMEEGIATYVEPLARSWVGEYSVRQVWADLVIGLPKGMPADDDRGLDRTPTWGRIYWGGAMFCTLADVEIRQRTKNQRGLIDALRAILTASGGIESEWPITRAFKAGDDATGTKVLEDLYARMKAAPVTPDLRDLWKELGVVSAGEQATFDNSAPEAAIRSAISARPVGIPANCGDQERAQSAS